MKFTDLVLESSLETSILKMGYDSCTPIQIAVIPEVLRGKDVSGLAQTGTGKTGAFLIPLMDRILKSRLDKSTLSPEKLELVQEREFKEFKPKEVVLVLVPTRELAEQVASNVEKLGVDSGLRAVSIYGGTGYDKQKEGIASGAEFIVATPGRLIDLYKEHALDLKQVRAVVFDEADRMFDMGFKDDMKYVLQRIPKDRQFLVFSATLNFDVLNTAYQFGADPIEIDVSRDQAKAENVKDSIFHVGHFDKPSYLLSLIRRHKPQQAMVFSNFKVNVERLAQFLTNNGHPAMGISSLLSQAQRNRVIEMFRESKTPAILVATDVAARGLDIKGTDLVINYELPEDAESYVHRIGRTGRAGTEGVAFSLVSDRDVESLSRVEAYLKHKLEMGWIEDAELIKDFEPLPNEHGSRFQRPMRAERPSGGRDERRGGPGGGRGGDRNRPPRREGGPREGGPRREGGAATSPGAAPVIGPAPVGEHKRHRKPDHHQQGQRPHQGEARGPRAPHSGPGGKPHGHGPQARHGKPHDSAKGGHPKHRNDQRHKGPKGHHTSRPGAAPAPKTIVAKVSAFFKKIFVGSSPTK